MNLFLSKKISFSFENSMPFRVQKNFLSLKKKKQKFLLGPNIWYGTKLPPILAKKSAFGRGLGKTLRAEIGRKIPLYRLFKRVSPTSPNISIKNLRKRPFFFSPEARNKKRANFERRSQQKYQNMFFDPLVSFLSLEKMQRKTNPAMTILKGKTMWFFEKAAPIPGVSSLKKHKKFYTEKRNAYKTFRRRLLGENKKTFLTLFENIQKNRKKTFLPKTWGPFVWRNSLFGTSLQKRIWRPNPRRRKALYGNISVNGKKRKKTNYILGHLQKRGTRPGDFSFFQKQGLRKSSASLRKNFQKKCSFSFFKKKRSFSILKKMGCRQVVRH